MASVLRILGIGSARARTRAESKAVTDRRASWPPPPPDPATLSARTKQHVDTTVAAPGDLVAAIQAATTPTVIDRSAALRAARPSMLARLRAALSNSAPSDPIRSAASVSRETIPAPDLTAAIIAAQQKGRK